MDEYSGKIRLGDSVYRDVGSQGVGQSYSGPEVTAIPTERENLTQRLDRLEKEFVEFRQHVLATLEKLSNQIGSINSYIGR